MAKPGLTGSWPWSGVYSTTGPRASCPSTQPSLPASLLPAALSQYTAVRGSAPASHIVSSFFRNGKCKSRDARGTPPPPPLLLRRSCPSFPSVMGYETGASLPFAKSPPQPLLLQGPHLVRGMFGGRSVFPGNGIPERRVQALARMLCH